MSPNAAATNCDSESVAVAERKKAPNVSMNRVYLRRDTDETVNMWLEGWPDNSSVAKAYFFGILYLDMNQQTLHNTAIICFPILHVDNTDECFTISVLNMWSDKRWNKTAKWNWVTNLWLVWQLSKRDLP